MTQRDRQSGVTFRRFLPHRQFLGSTAAIILGVLYFISGPASIQSGGDGAGLIAGPIMILGAAAYRSRKRRLIGLKPGTLLTRALEAAALAIILLLVGLQNDLLTLIRMDPVPNLIIPLWACIAYFSIGMRIAKRNAKTLN